MPEGRCVGNYTLVGNFGWQLRNCFGLAHITEILGLKEVQSGSVSTLRELSDKFNAHIRALKGLGTTEQIAGFIIVQSGKVGRAFRGPCLRQHNSYVGVNILV